MNENMLYRRGAGEDMLSILGYGCMRFTKKGTGIDLDKAEREVMRAIRGGGPGVVAREARPHGGERGRVRQGARDAAARRARMSRRLDGGGQGAEVPAWPAPERE